MHIYATYWQKWMQNPANKWIYFCSPMSARAAAPKQLSFGLTAFCWCSFADAVTFFEN